MITWLIGKGENIDIIYSAYKYIPILNPEIAMNTYLFDDHNFKYTFSKKDTAIFKKNHNIFKNNIIIKGINVVNEEIMDKSKDNIINIDSLPTTKLFEYLIEISDIKFNENEQKYINSLPNLIDLATIITLKSLKIDQEMWKNFINDKRDFWTQKARNNTLIPEQIVKNDEIIPMINYLIASNHHKKMILMFIRSYIKSGKQIWKLDKFWESLLNN